MRNNMVIIQILLMVLFMACKKQDNIATIQQSNKIEGVLNEIKSHDNDCKVLFKKLIYGSSLKNPFMDSFDISMGEEEEGKILLKLFEQSDAQENAVGWIIFDAKNKKLLDITNDIENPVELNYNIKLWNEIIVCYFNSNKDYKIFENEKTRCKDIPIEYGSQEECFFEDTSIQSVYEKMIKDAEMKESEFLVPNLPSENTNKEINQNGLISVNYNISPNLIEIEFLFEGGVTYLVLEQMGKNVKRTISYSAD